MDLGSLSPQERTGLEAAFWRLVQKSEGCWLWMGRRVRDGYGGYQFKWKGRNVCRQAHRFAYELMAGPIPAGLILRHACDNPACVRPDHLAPGTQVQNMQEMVARGRHSGPRRKLTATAVRDIRCRYAAGGVSQRVLAREYGVRQNTIHRVIHRQIWAHAEQGNETEPA